MTSANEDPPKGRSQSTSPRKGKGENAFDMWLQRGLHQMFDEAASEPIPEELLRLIEDDRGN